MKRRSYAPNRIITVSNVAEIDDYSASNSSRHLYPVQSVRTFRQVDYSRLRQPITLPRWSRNVAYRQYDSPPVPQLTPEIRVMPMEDYMVYEGEEDPVEIDPDGQVDVCALEEDGGEGGTSPKQPRLQSGPSGLVKEEKANLDEGEDDDQQTRSERYRILRRSGTAAANGETLASRARRENADEVMAEFGEVVGDGTGELVQEEVEIVDQDEHISRYGYMYGATVPMLARRATYADPRAVVNLNELYDEMARYAPTSTVDAFNEVFGTESTMSHPLNVKALMQLVKSPSTEQNAKTNAAMGMQINYLKRELNKIREELVDTRSATLQRQNHGLTNRNFDLTAQVSQQWFIDADPPLREVDLVKTAREVSLRIGRKHMKTRDVITRFVRAIFDQMIPADKVREYTVRDRPSTRGLVKDIGITPKNQIIGIVLDLMSLYNAEDLSPHSRVDRAQFSDCVNSTMKTVIYDMRRISPKSRKAGTRALSNDLTHEGLEEEEEED